MTHSFPTRRPSELHQLLRRGEGHARLLRQQRRRQPRLAAPRLGMPGGCGHHHDGIIGERRKAHKLQSDRFVPIGHVGASAREVKRLFRWRSEEHTSELQSLMRISYAVFCLKKKTKHTST